MVNKDMNGFPVKKCSAFQFFKKRVRRWIKSPMVNAEKHPHTSLKYPGSTVMHLPPGDSELEPPLCQTCLSDHPFQLGIAPHEAESCSWESQRNSKVSGYSDQFEEGLIETNLIKTHHRREYICIPYSYFQHRTMEKNHYRLFTVIVIA